MLFSSATRKKKIKAKDKILFGLSNFVVKTIRRGKFEFIENETESTLFKTW